VKIRNSAFSIGRIFGPINRNGKKIILEPLDESIAIWFLFNWSRGNFNWLKVVK